MTNWPLEGGTTGIVSVDRNLRGILKRGGELAASALTKAEAKELFPQLPAKANRRLIAGQVSAAGAKVLGEGFSSEKTGTGKYTIKISPELASTAVCTANYAGAGAAFGLDIVSSSKTEVKIEIFNSASANADLAFNFIILG